VLTACCLAAPLCAGEFDPSAYRQQVDNPTRVMVLGTAHLSNAEDGWDPAVLAPLLDRLAGLAPYIITIENQPGPTTHKLWAYRAIMPEVAATYAGQAMEMATTAGLSLDMDMPQAEAALRQAIAKLRDDPARLTGAGSRRCLRRRAIPIRRWCNGGTCRLPSASRATASRAVSPRSLMNSGRRTRKAC
jgi:hypothetical protein